jgi:hypothetical protein
MDSPYQEYTVALSHAGRAALEAEIAQQHIVASHLRGKKVTKANFVSAADLVLELATATYRRHGMP